MKHLINKIRAGIVASLSLITALTAHAQLTPGTGQVPQYQQVTVSNITTLSAIFTQGIRWLAAFVFGVGVIMILWAGFKFITAGDNEEEVGKARQMITYGIVGLLVAGLAYSLPVIVQTFLMGGL